MQCPVYAVLRYVQCLKKFERKGTFQLCLTFEKKLTSGAELRQTWLSLAELQFQSSWIEGGFHLFKIVPSSTKVDLQMQLLLTFSYIQLFRSSSIEVVFHIYKKNQALLNQAYKSQKANFVHSAIKVIIRLSSMKVVFHL